MKIKKRVLGVAATSVFVTACSTPVVSPDNLASQWGDRLRAYQIFPVFPPREDVQAGDIYLVCDVLPGSDPNTAHAGPPPQSVWIARLELSDLINANYGDAIHLPPLAAQNTKGALTEPNSIGAMPSSSDLVSRGKKFEQLRNVSLPEFFSTSITSVQASALVPAGVVLAGLGLASDDIASISLNIPAAGSYGIPFWNAQVAIQDQIKKKLGPDFWGWADGMKKYYARRCAPNETPALLAITEIYAAYAISVNFAFERAAAGRLEAKLNTPANTTRSATLLALTKAVADAQTAQADKQAAASKDANAKDSGAKDAGAKNAGAKDAGAKAASAPGPAGAPGADADSGTSAGTPQAQLNALLALLASQAAGIEQQKFAGVTAQVISGSISGIRVERVFSNPVVIGYKAMNVSQPIAPKVDPRAGTTSSSQQQSGPPEDPFPINPGLLNQQWTLPFYDPASGAAGK
ncbi:hypothetical protein PQQ65_31200 [Paraburkholderia strydomiana]|uniref:hypothetical protein n=1 Tax=Paraburkholderia strydomiana TaxID=1245417 RepID=UPI0038BBCF04